jgi:flagellar basal body-associated protein FliL
MEKNKYLKEKFIILIIILGVLIVKLISVRAQYFSYEYEKVSQPKEKQNIRIKDKYGYGEILEVLRKNKGLQLKSMKMNEDEKCNIEVNYTGDVKLLYNCLYSLIEEPCIIGINVINISKDNNMVTINMDFKKNR